MKKILSVVGARPNFMKMAPIHRELLKYKNRIIHKVVHTGQHYDFKMSDVFFQDLDLPKPDIFLGAGSDTHSIQTANIMVKFEKVVEREQPDLVLVYGDVNSTVAAGLVCAKYHKNGIPIRLGHVESGLRSRDKRMPEEINRILTDNIAELLFVTEKNGIANLIKSGFSMDRIHFCGNTMIDSLKFFLEASKKNRIIKELCVSPKKFALITMHRPSNVDSADNLKKLFRIFGKIVKLMPDIDLIFPIHPRTLKMINKFKIEHFYDLKNLIITEPLGYRDFLCLLKNAKFVMTDSGGIQEETTYLKIPCITLRENTERPVTITQGTNELCGLDEKKILGCITNIKTGRFKKGKIPTFWDGNAARRIVKVILKNI